MARFVLLVAVVVSVTVSAATLAEPSRVAQAAMTFHRSQELRRPCQRTPPPVRVSSAAFRDADDPQRQELLSRCDCGQLRGCRCAEPMWDSLRARDDPADRQEEGMDDQGYRQLGY